MIKLIVAAMIAAICGALAIGAAIDIEKERHKTRWPL